MNEKGDNMNENENKEVIPVSDNQEVVTEQQNAVSVEPAPTNEVAPAVEANQEVAPADVNPNVVAPTSDVSPAPVVEQPAAVQTEEVNQNVEVQPAVDNSANQNPVENNNDNNKGPSTFAKIMTVLLFGGLFAFVYFLGDITEYINLKKAEKNSMEITNGRLLCTNEKTTENLSVQLSVVFKFENKGIVSLEYVTTSTGDKIKDKEELAELNNNCKTLKEETADYDGVSVICSLSNGTSVVKQNFDYSSINTDEVTAAFAEAGGVYPNFKYKDDINSVESKMIASDYTCEKTSN